MRSNAKTLLCATVLAATALAGARSVAAEPVTITLWNGFAASETAALSRMIQKYWAPTHPNIKVAVYGEKNGQAILTAISGGDPPDVVMSPDSESAGLWFHSGAIEDLTPFVAPFEAQLNEQIVPAALEWDHHGKTWFALPFVDYNWALFYNKTMFRQAGLDPDHPPTTIAELADDARKLTRLDPSGNIIQLGWLPISDEWGAMGLGLVFGAKFVDASGAPTLDTPQLVRALEWDSGLARSIGLQKVSAFTSGFTHGDNAFQLGKAAMMLDGSWQSVMLKSNKSLDFGVAPMPAAEPAFAHANNVGSNPIVIPRGAPHKAEALEFAKFMALNGNLAAEFSNVIANIPHVKDRLADFATDPNVRMLARLSNEPDAVAWAPVPYARRYADELAADVGQIYNDGAPVAQVLRQSQAVIADEAKGYQ